MEVSFNSNLQFTVSWKFSGLVCMFVVNISYNSCITEYQYKISRSKLGSTDIEFSNLGKCQLTHMLIG